MSSSLINTNKYILVIFGINRECDTMEIRKEGIGKHKLQMASIQQGIIVEILYDSSH